MLDTKYIEALKTILDTGTVKSDRTGTGTISVFGLEIRHNLAEGFPLLTTKKVHFKSVIHELIWLLSGSTNISYLQKHNVKIWDAWSAKNFDYRDDTRKGIWIPTKKLPYTPYSGNFSTATDEEFHNEQPLKNQWKKMMQRCYDSSAHNYSNYGGKGISVCKEWHDCATFIQDVKEIPNWDLKLLDYNSYELDKDYYGSNTYSKDTCMWLHSSENTLYIGNPIKVEYRDNTYDFFHSFSELEKLTGLSSSTAHRWLKTGIPTTRKQGAKAFSNILNISYAHSEGAVFRKDTKLGEVGKLYPYQWRKSGGIDQIKDLIKGLKNDPNSRRHLVSAWSVAELNEMALAPCHYSFQCYVADGKLSMIVNQRSADMFLGVPFNIASYALLTHMLAQICELEVGELIWRGGDCHIYLNHIDQVNEQIGRHTRGEVYDLPNIELDKDIMDIDDFTYEDITLCNYQSGSSIKGDVSV